MICWAWLIWAVFGGFIFGVFLIGLLTAGATESSYRTGFQEGHDEGFRDGLKEFGQAGLGDTPLDSPPILPDLEILHD